MSASRKHASVVLAVVLIACCLGIASVGSTGALATCAIDGSITVAQQASESQGQAGAYSGTCGDNLAWTFDPEMGALTISGSGKMTSFSSLDPVPWSSYKADITSVSIGSAVTSIGYEAFRECASLASVVIPASVTSIENHAFDGCTSLKTVTFAEGSQCASIGYEAFEGCTSLASIDIPASVTSIESYAFRECTSLASFTVAAGNAVYSTDGRALFTGDGTALIAYANASGSSYVVPASVTFINNSAFEACSALVAVTFAEGSQCTSIGEYAFSLCTSLYGISIPSSVTSIGACAFQSCMHLVSINTPSSLASIGKLAFSGCTSLVSIDIPISVTLVGDHAFNYCDTLTVYYAGTEEEADAIGRQSAGGTWVFNHTHVLRKADVDAVAATCTSAGYVADQCFCGVYYNYRVVPALGHNAQAVEAQAPTCTEAGHVAGTVCSRCGALLSGEVIPALGHDWDKVAYAWSSDYSKCTATRACKRNGCAALETAEAVVTDEVTQAATATEYGVHTYTATFFASWTSTQTAVEAIEKTGQQPSGGQGQTEANSGTCGAGLTWSYNPETSALTIDGTGAMNDQLFSCCPYAESVKSISISSSVTSIGNFAFSGCASLVSIDIPASVTSIGAVAFSGCESLVSIDIPASVTSIGNFAFSGCTSLVSVSIPASVTSIGAFAFNDCTALVSVDLPVSVTSVGDNAFYCCDSLSVHYAGTEAEADAIGRQTAGGTWVCAQSSTGDQGQSGSTENDQSSTGVQSRTQSVESSQSSTGDQNETDAGTQSQHPAKAAQTAAKVKTSTLTAKGCKNKKLKKAKTFTLVASNVKGGAKVTWKRASVSKKAKKFIKVASNGKVTVKKGLKKGAYKVKVQMVIAATASYAAKTVTKTITVKVK